MLLVDDNNLCGLFHMSFMKYVSQAKNIQLLTSLLHSINIYRSRIFFSGFHFMTLFLHILHCIHTAPWSYTSSSLMTVVVQTIQRKAFWTCNRVVNPVNLWRNILSIFKKTKLWTLPNATECDFNKCNAATNSCTRITIS